MIKDYKPQLRKLLQKPLWKIALIILVVNALLLSQQAIDFYYYHNFNFLFNRRAFVKRTIARGHWVGAQIAKPHRLAFTLLFVVLLVGIIKAPHIQAVLYWSIGWGALFSVFVMVKSLVRIQRSLIRPTYK